MDIGTYIINQTTIPAGVIPIITVGQISVHGTTINPTIEFIVVPDTTIFDDSDVIDVENIDIDTDVFNEIELPIQLTIVTNGIQEAITSVDDLPTTKFAGINNASAITSATNSQSSLLYKDLSELGRDEEASTIINEFRLNATDTGNSTSLVFIGVLSATAESPVYGQYLATQPVDSFNCGQRYIFPLDDTLLTSFGGIKKIDFTTFVNGTCTETEDYITYEIARTPPATAAPTLQNNGINQDTLLYINAQFPASLTNGAGFDFGNSTNIDSYTLTVVSEMPETGNINDLTVYIFDESSNKWVTSGVNVLSRTQTGSFAELEVQVDHTSMFSVGGERSPSSPTSGESPGSNGRGLVGVGPSSGSGGGGAPVGGGSTPSSTNIDSVYYNVCDENIVRIILSGELPSNVIIQTTNSGIVTAKPVLYQPYSDDNKITETGRYVYEAPIASHETYFVVSVDGVVDDSLQGIQIVGCEGNTIFEQEDPRVRPQIFDFKFWTENNTTIRPVIDDYNYQNTPEDVFVSAIIDSKYSQLRSAELRMSDPTSDSDTYTSIQMNMQELEISNTTSIVQVVIPAQMLITPAIQFWVHAINEEGKSNDSIVAMLGIEHYSNDYSQIDIEMDTRLVKAQGQTYRPIGYVNNEEDTPVYGQVSLLINGEAVDSISRIFAQGESNVEFEWSVPQEIELTNYNVTTSVNLYGYKQVTESTILTTYDKSESIPLNDFTKPLSYIEDANGNPIARPALIYASQLNSAGERFHVTAPDGTCIIGSSESCIVSESTAGQRGGLTSIDIDGQIYRVKYSGYENSLERFSITSFDPIIGNWKVELESEQGIVQQAHASTDIEVKVKYRGEKSEIVTMVSR